MLPQFPDHALSPSPQSSPLAEAHSRRRSQYKSRTPTQPPQRRTASTNHGSLVPIPFALSRRTVSVDSPQKTLLKERFEARCIERAQRRCERAALARNWNASGSEGSSDGADEDSMNCDEEEEDEEFVMQDEVRLFSIGYCVLTR
jgi:hypothetical protein